MSENTLLKEYEAILRKFHKTEKHLDFLTNCNKEKILPKFTTIPRKVKESLDLNNHQVKKYREKKLHKAINEKNLLLSELKLKLTELFSRLLNFFTQYELNQKTSIFNSRISKTEKMADAKRELKLKKLRDQNFNTVHAKVTIHNFTDIIIPPNIEKILELGIHAAIGGHAQKNTILTKFENFFKEWTNHAQSINLDMLKITEIKSLLFLEFFKIH